MAAARGRGSAYAAVVLMQLLALICVVAVDEAYAATHTVGGSKGWDLSVDYTSWAKGETFKVGDVLFFPYSKAFHNVVVVDKAGYDSCSAANAIATYNVGNDNVTLDSAGSHYYLCSVVGHCSGGMKLAVTVAAAGAPPPAAPSTVPVPAPSKTPPSAPSPALNTVPPSPSPAPASAAPAPSATTPTPAPAPATPASTPSTAPASTPATAPGSAPSTTPTSPPSSSTPPPSAAPSATAGTATFAPFTLLIASLLFSL